MSYRDCTTMLIRQSIEVIERRVRKSVASRGIDVAHCSSRRLSCVGVKPASAHALQVFISVVICLTKSFFDAATHSIKRSFSAMHFKSNSLLQSLTPGTILPQTTELERSAEFGELL